MLALARVLSQKPMVILLDEPSAGLSEALWRRLALLLTELSKQGLSVIIVEHRLKGMTGIRAKGYLITMGKIAAQGPWEEIFGQLISRNTLLGINSPVDIQ